MTPRQYLQDSRLFEGVGPDLLDAVSPHCRESSVEKGTALFTQGEPASHFPASHLPASHLPASHLNVVAQGRVALKMVLERPDGSVTPSIAVASLGPGEAFGWSAIVEPNVFTMSAEAVEDSKLVLIEGSGLQAVLSRHEGAGYRVMANIARVLAQRLSSIREAFVDERSWVFWMEQQDR